MTPLDLALLKKIKTDPADYHNRLYVYDLLWFKAREFELNEVEQAAIDEYVTLYGNPLAPKPQGVLKL